mmetsp:Transcript_110522/g.311724  ORF Transcript_110522/g.311724 Transcript_110522/m.311724 type:complete len:247 (-) Transcript_110522:781-1521(-)
MLEDDGTCIALRNEHCRPRRMLAVVLASAVYRVAAVKTEHEATAADWRDSPVAEVERAPCEKRLKMFVALAALAQPYRIRCLEETAIHDEACALLLEEQGAVGWRATHAHDRGLIGGPQLEVPQVPAPLAVVAMPTLQRWDQTLIRVRGELEEQQAAVHDWMHQHLCSATRPLCRLAIINVLLRSCRLLCHFSCSCLLLCFFFCSCLLLCLFSCGCLLLCLPCGFSPLGIRITELSSVQDDVFTIH